MRKLKLAIVLPVLQCGLEGILWYWGRHARPSVPVYEHIMVPSATVISSGLNAPATFFAWSLYMLLDWLWDIAWPQRTVGPPGSQLVFLLCVAGCWYLIGRWLDGRAAGKDQLRPRRFTTRGLLFRLLLLGTGVFFLLFSFHWVISYFSETIARALLQTWAVFLIGVPGVALTRWLRQLGRREDSVEPGQRASKPLSNFRWFLIGAGLFAAFLIYAFLTNAYARRF
jgi:hypothetical protein